MSGSGGFQQTVASQPVMAIAGDFCSNNPWFSYDAGPGGLVAGVGGVSIGRFAWAYPPADQDGTPTTVLNSGNRKVDGFVHRAQQGLIVNYLANAGMVIQPGFQMGIMAAGDFWCVNDGTTEAQVGQKAFAILATGKVQFAAAGTNPGGASATSSSIAASTFSVTGSVNNDVLTVTVVGSGTVYPGSTISGTGIATGTQVVSQLTGTAGGVGTYRLNVADQSAASTTVSGTYGTLTVGTATGTFAVGDILTGSGVVAGTAITASITGSGGTGATMAVNNNTVVSSTTITSNKAVETNWYARSAGQAGELVKISTVATGPTA